MWNPGDLGTVKFMYGTSFLAPSPYAAYASFGGFASTDGGVTYRSQFVRLPNPRLKPIESKTYEVSYQGFLGDAWGLTLDLYRMELDRLYNVDSDTGPGKTNLYPDKRYKGWPVDYIEVRINQGRQHNLGGNAQVDYRWPLASGKLAAYVSWSFVDGKVDPLGDGREVEIDRVASSILRAGAEFTTRRWGLSLRAAQVGAQRLPGFSKDANGQTTDRRYTLDGYLTVDLNLRYQLRSWLTATLGVSNLLDARYRNITAFSDPYGNSAQFTGSPQYPRRVLMGLTARF